MSDNSISNSVLPPQQDARIGLWIGLSVLLSVILMASVSWALWLRSRPAPPTGCAADKYGDECLRSVLVSYLAQPAFSGLELERQALGEAHLELYTVDKRELYLSLPADVPVETELAKLLVNPAQIETAQEVNGRWHLGDYRLLKSREKGFFCKSALSNLRIRPEQIFEFSLETIKYRLSFRELADFSGNRSTYNGMLRADTGLSEDGNHLVFFNHGAFVAPASEPSLKRMVAELTQDISPADPLAREKRVQRLVDVVAEDIAYDFVEATLSYETLKRPNETLMTRQSDCSNKAILLASLLEQLDEDYLLLYVPEHITVGVKQGGFSNRNGLVFRFEGNDWLIAESTTRGFKIGVTRLEDSERLLNVKYVQRPRVKNLIFNLKNMQPLEFR